MCDHTASHRLSFCWSNDIHACKTGKINNITLLVGKKNCSTYCNVIEDVN